jgi:signal transduction histidine kinase
MKDPGSHLPLGGEVTPGLLTMLDCAAAVVYTLLLLSFAIGGGGRLASPASGVPLWARCVVVAGIGLPLAVRRLRPRAVFCVVFVASLLAALTGVVNDAFVGAAFALYALALTRPRRRRAPTFAVAAVSAVAALGTALAGPSTVAWAAIPLDCAVLGGAWTIGRAVRERRAYVARSTAQLADQAATDERLRIARELHDIVAHSMSVIAVKAGVANHVMGARPDEARDALQVIETTSRQALTEMRHAVRVLRTDEAPGCLGPAPGVDGLPELADRAAKAGVRVSLRVCGLERVPDGVALSIYRIVQEALTNVVKHAEPASCRVAVEADGRRVRIDVNDNGSGRRLPAAGAPGQGHGLAGIRERVAMYGGSLRVGPRPDGGFCVAVSLPYEPVGGPG